MMDQETPRKATRREWIGLAVIALPCLLYSMDLTVLNLAVPRLSADLKPTASQLLWIVDIYGFMIAGALITMGTLGDRIGRRKLLLIGAAAFGLASIPAAFATSAPMLILARAMLGLAAATLAPSTLSLISNMFPDPRERTAAIGLWIASFLAGGALGPVIGGVLLEYFWWGSVFLINLPVMALLLVLAPWLLPEYRDPAARRLDIPSAALSVLTVLPVIYGMKRIAESGFDAFAAISILAGLAVGTAFAMRQMRLADPLIDLTLFRIPTFSAALTVNLLGFSTMFGFFLLAAQYMQLVLGMGPLEAGLWGLPSSLCFILGSMLAPRIVHRFRPAYVMAGGLVVAATGFVLMTQVPAGGGLPLLIGAFCLQSLGLVPVVTLTTDLVVSAVPPERAGVASGLSETSAEFGGALGIAVLGSIVTAVYRDAMDAGLPQGLDPAIAQTVRDTLGGAVAASGEVGGAMGAAMLEAARIAYGDAFQLAAAVSALLALASAFLALALLRRADARPAGPELGPAAAVACE
ncbi:MAG TPA: MFS transporter [Mesorhizobium sp.]|jgi:DHA2 family multidrug resistance protein-like MFS transporter|nr:MFS transporter [Mesorhizobium sp.]